MKNRACFFFSELVLDWLPLSPNPRLGRNTGGPFLFLMIVVVSAVEGRNTSRLFHNNYSTGQSFL